MVENFPNSARDISLQIEEEEQTYPKQDKLKDFTQGCILIKLLKASDKENSNASRGK